MTKYTIKSTSDEGVYFLVNGWEKHGTFWISEAEVQNNPDKAKSMFFTAPRFAKASLTKLLKVMDDYKTDTFEMVSFCVNLDNSTFSEYNTLNCTPTTKGE